MQRATPTMPSAARAVLAGALCSLYSLLAGPAAANPAAAPPAADEAHWLHRIEPGDTLIGLRDRLMWPGSDWRVVRRLNGVADPRRLRPGRDLRIPMAMMRMELQAVEVLHRHGQVQVQRGDAPPQPLAERSVLAAGDWVLTGPQSSISLRFADGGHVLLGPDSRLRIERHARLGAAQVLDTQLELRSGGADLRLPATAPPPRLNLRTPLVNLGVRGTEFRGRVDGDRVLTEVEQGRVAVGQRLLSAGQGAVADAAGVGPAQPLLPLPDLSTLPVRAERLSLELPFEARAGAAGYRARIFTPLPDNMLVLDGLFERPLAAWTTDLPDGLYELRVRAVDPAGLEGREARANFILKARPEPPLLLLPRADEALPDETVQFSWSRQTEAARYRLQVADDPQFLRPLVLREDLDTTEARLPLPLGRWYWRLSSVRADGDRGPWSDPRALQRVDPPPPPLPSAPATAPPRRSDAGVLLAWSPSAVPGVRYQVQVARDEAFADLVLERTVDEAETLFERPAAGRYFVRIRAVDAAGRAGPFGAVQVVEVPRSLSWLWLLTLLLLLL